MAPIAFFTPHQDDETLSMGSAVRSQLEAGHDVQVVLLTTGQNSGVRTQLNMAPDQFTAARDDEMVRSCRQLGLAYSNVHVSPGRPEDGQLTVQKATELLENFYASHPGVSCRTYTNLPAPGRHPDHQALGQAAVDLAAKGVITDLRLYIEPWLLDAFKSANPDVQVTTERAASMEAVRRASDEYAIQDEVAGKWGIGYRSVKSFFDAGRPDPASYYHVPALT